MSAPFRHPLRVRYNECDPQNIVFNGNYLTYFDVGVTELWREAIGGWDKITEEGVDAVVAEATVRYLAPLRFDDEFAVTLTAGRIGNSSLVIELTIERGDERCAEGELRYVFIEPGGGPKASIPEKLRAALEPYAAGA